MDEGQHLERSFWAARYPVLVVLTVNVICPYLSLQLELSKSMVNESLSIG